jgi:hypothetical protein
MNETSVSPSSCPEEDMMRRLNAVVVGLLFCAAPALAQVPRPAAKARATAPEIAYESVPNFYRMPPGL